MELNVENLKTKAEALRKESNEYAATQQKEINSLQEQLGQLQQGIQAKIKEAQRKIDMDAGKITGIEDLIKEMGDNPDAKVTGLLASKVDEPATTD